eukprot:scaffold234633_cov46-Prasinocladus_malaysianus.AAC.2
MNPRDKLSHNIMLAHRLTAIQLLAAKLSGNSYQYGLKFAMASSNLSLISFAQSSPLQPDSLFFPPTNDFLYEACSLLHAGLN